jgi:CBS domain-containing protein
VDTRAIAGVTVGMIMRTPVVTTEGDATLRDAASALRDADVGSLAVVEASGIAGIVSERDVTRAIADGADPDEIWVADVMSGEPRYVTSGDEIATARETMLAAGIRHLPVLDEGELVGIVSVRDILRSGRHLVLDEEDLVELLSLLRDTLAELSHEIADTDNASYRGMLRRRRERIRRVRDALGE